MRRLLRIIGNTPKHVHVYGEVLGESLLHVVRITSTDIGEPSQHIRAKVPTIRASSKYKGGKKKRMRKRIATKPYTSGLQVEGLARQRAKRGK